MTTKTRGYLVLFKLPDVAISYDDADSLARDVGFDDAGQDGKLKYVPQPPRKRNAWEKATNLGARGIVVEPPQALKDQIKKKYGVEPTVRLVTKVISRTAPQLVRHIVREVTIPVRDSDVRSPGQASADKRKLASRQLSSQTVCILEFDTSLNKMKSTSYSQLHDDDGWVNGNLENEVKRIEDNVDKALNYADGDMVRAGIRDWLAANNATLQSSGGAYFIPYKAGLVDKLKSVKAYLEALKPFATNKNDRPQFTVYPVSADGDAFDTTLDIAENAIDSLKADLQSVVDRIKPVINGERTENVADKLRTEATVAFMEINQKISQYREVLDDDLKQLGMFLEMTESAIMKAQTVDVYREPATRKKAE